MDEHARFCLEYIVRWIRFDQAIRQRHVQDALDMLIHYARHRLDAEETMTLANELRAAVAQMEPSALRELLLECSDGLIELSVRKNSASISPGVSTDALGTLADLSGAPAHSSAVTARRPSGDG